MSLQSYHIYHRKMLPTVLGCFFWGDWIPSCQATTHHQPTPDPLPCRPWAAPLNGASPSAVSPGRCSASAHSCRWRWSPPCCGPQRREWLESPPAWAAHPGWWGSRKDLGWSWHHAFQLFKGRNIEQKIYRKHAHLAQGCPICSRKSGNHSPKFIT